MADVLETDDWDAESATPTTTPPSSPLPFSLVGATEGLWSPLEPIVYEVGGIVPRASVVLLAGYSSSLKSWAALAMAFAKGAGLPWFGHSPFATERGAVSYLDREAGIYELRRRLHAIRRPLDVMPDPLLDVCSFPPGGLFDSGFRSRLADLAARRAMILLDTLAAFSGNVDQNSAQMGDGVGFCAEVASQTKTTIVLVTHDKKKGADGDAIDPRERVRGSSAIFAAADVVLSMHRAAPIEPVDVVQTKARNGREVDPFRVRMLDAPGGGVTFRVETTAVMSKRPLTPTETIDALVDAVVEVVRDNPRSTASYVAGALKGRRAAILAAVERATAKGRIRNLGSPKAAAYVVAEEGGAR